MNESNYKVYIIKSKSSGKSYVGFTNSQNPDYNPLFYLYNKYKSDKTHYIELGESVNQYKLRDHVTKFIKTDLPKDEAEKITLKLREKLGDKSLNDKVKIIDLFDEELALLDA